MPESSPGELKIKAELYHYAAHVTDVYDGDTLTADIDLGVGIWRRGQQVRLWKLNTPEVRGNQRERGEAVRDFVRGLVLDKNVLIRTILDKRGNDSTEKYGRLLGEILVENEQGEVINLNDLLLAEGMAVPMRSDGTIAGLASAFEAALTDHVSCPLCGEKRAVERETRTVEPCPNCFDEAFSL